MTILQAKEKTLKLLDEVKTSSSAKGYLSKLNSFFDMAQREIATTAKAILRAQQIHAKDGKAQLPQRCYRVRRILDASMAPVPWDQLSDTLLLEDGEYTAEFEAYPLPITEVTPDDTVFEIDEEAQEAIPYFAAAMCMDMEHDQRFFQSFFAQYQGRLTNLVMSPPTGGGRKIQTIYRM